MSSETVLLFDITLMLIVSGVCSIVLKKLKLPTIIGYLIAGFLLGPHIFPEVVIQESTVTIFASMGIVLLMFYIGLELNLRGLKKVASYAMIIVAIEMTMMVVIGYALGLGLGMESAQALFLGVTISCASTAVVLGVIKDNEHMKGRLSRAVTGILIMEDIGLIVILALATPIIGGTTSTSMVETIVIIVSFIGITVVMGLALIPRFMDWVNKHYSGETLFLVAVGIGFGLSLVSSALGLSVAIGAFLAGILISQSTCSKVVERKVEPMKEMFMAIFFISIGLQLDPGLIWAGLPLAITIAVIFIVGKMTSVIIGCYAANFRSRSSFYIAASMVSMGEFTFVVAKVALDGNLIGMDIYSSVIAAAVITMVMLPYISRSSPGVFSWLIKKAPAKMVNTMSRIEGSRLEARESMAKSSKIRSTVHKQIYLIFIDFVLIIGTLLAINLITIIKDFVTAASGSDSIASVVLLVMALIVIIPATIHLAQRISVIAISLSMQSAHERNHSLSAMMRTYRLFMNIGTAISFILLIVLIYPLLPSIKGLPISSFEVVIGVMIVSWLAWDVIDRRYDRVTTALSNSIETGGRESDAEKS
ncbi:MAG TPA: cation:proton antiporter [Methanomassiliicoccales archaeon]|jgi:CPA2 family monovalent cation:H+ antiporter-2